MSNEEYIEIIGAKEHNLKNISLKIPKNKLVVITGVSGSGKSSLAFDVIYNEGRRRYIESLSSYARQFLGNGKVPHVDKINGLSPSIAIDQKTTSHNPRSTVGTVTEIYDYLRVFWARIGTPYCPNHNIPIKPQTTKEIINFIFKKNLNNRINILSPIVTKQKGTHQDLLDKLRKDGYVRVKVNENTYLLEDEIKLSKNKKHTISIVVDRLIASKDKVDRLNEAIDVASEYSGGLVLVENIDINSEELFSKNYSCKYGDFSISELEPRLFSYNSPIGFCPKCKGIGFEKKVQWRLIVANSNLSIKEGGLNYFKHTVDTTNIEWQLFKILLDHYNINYSKKISELTEDEIDIIMNGSKEEIFYSIKSASGMKVETKRFIEGIAKAIERRYIETSVERRREWYSKFMDEEVCGLCNGKKLKEESLSVLINGINIIELTSFSVEKSLEWMKNIKLNSVEKKISELVLKELISRLQFMVDVGLEYLSLDRSSSTLSGGESQRIRLATQIGSSLTGVIYVLDEPSIGLHQRDNDRLILTLKHMQEIGNTVLVVEHDYDTIMNSDYVIDIGPKAGSLGGEVVAYGEPKELIKNKNSLTADYISGRKKIEIPKKRRNGKGKFVEFTILDKNNIKNETFKIPLNVMTVVTGVSGSGKSTMLSDSFYKIVKAKIDPKNNPINYKSFSSMKGFENVDKIIKISQDPIGRTPRSNPATYTGAFDIIRDIFADVPEAKEKGFLKGRFSFNVPGGRCEKCQGDGELKISMNFLPDVTVKCDECNGSRYNDETLSIKFKDKTIFDILEMSISDALVFFSSFPKLYNKLSYLEEVGLGYLKVGHPATLLSGGEAQRVKLATFLEKKPTGKTVYILDEPTTGLHMDDVNRLISVLNRIVDGGDTILIIEHNMDIIKVSDWIIDMGLGGGDKGGKVIASGTPEKIIKSMKSYTAKYLDIALKDDSK